MIRAVRSKLILPSLALLGAAGLVSASAWAAPHNRSAKPKASASTSEKASGKQTAGKPDLVGNFGPWGAYVASGKDPTCYVLSQPQERAPTALKRDPAYVFISTRPAEHVRDEISVVMGFDVKADASPPAKAEIGSTHFDMVAKGADLWLKDESQDAVMLAAMKKSGRMTITAPSSRGKTTTDSYSLTGLTQALDRVSKSCK